VIEPSLALEGDSYEKATGFLDAFLASSQARCALVVDRRGFVLVHREAVWAPRPASLDSVGTLVAGNAAATSALAGLLGESRFREQVHQGDGVGLYVQELSPEALLAVVFDDSVPLGRVKLHARKAVEEIVPLFVPMSGNAVVPLGDGFVAEAGALLDGLFGGDDA
jgi:predicted regulator of Ras-like GTPase activity (Roadblock/LC7/MglB family)